MFQRIRQRFSDMRTIHALCTGAERHANAEGQHKPGAEHFVLAAIELPDRTARKAFARLQTDPDGYRGAIARQYEDALRALGIAVPEGAIRGTGVVPPQGTRLYRAQPSADAVMQHLAAQRKTDPDGPLLGAHVLLAAASAQYGVAIRALLAMGVAPAELARAARAEIDTFRRSRPS